MQSKKIAIFLLSLPSLFYLAIALLCYDNSRAEQVVRIILSIGMMLFFQTVYWLTTEAGLFWSALSKNSRNFYYRWFFVSICIAAYQGLWIAAQWPGLFNYDVFANYLTIQDGRFTEWTSWLYSAYLMVFQEMGLGPGFVTVFQGISFSVFLGFIASQVTSLGVPVIATGLFLALLVGSPLNSGLLVYLGRDIPFAWLETFVLSLILWERFSSFKGNTKDRSNRSLVFYAFLLSTMAKLRLDARIEILTILIAWVYLGKWSKRDVTKFLGILTPTLLLFFYLVPEWTQSSLKPNLYALSAITNPLCELVQTPDVFKNAPEDQVTLEKIFPFTAFIQMCDLYEIPAFHRKIFRYEFNSEDFYNLTKLYVRLIFRYPEVFFKNRSRMFLATLGLQGPTVYLHDDLLADYPVAIEARTKLELEKNDRFEDLRLWQNRLLWSFTQDKSASLFLIFNSAILGLFFVVLAILLARQTPACAIMCMCLLTRISVVFLMAPACHFKYIYSVYILGFLMPLYLWAEVKHRRLNSGPSANGHQI